MKATFALLADREICNSVRALSWYLHSTYQTGLKAGILPPHVSLKQPFNVSNLSRLERYFERLAGSIAPVEITLSGLDVVVMWTPTTTRGVVWLNVVETPQLRALHERVNADLLQQFGNTAAQFDGPEYQFHMTVALSEQSNEIYSRIKADRSASYKRQTYIAHEIAMFVYDDALPDTPYMTYKVSALQA